MGRNRSDWMSSEVSAGQADDSALEASPFSGYIDCKSVVWNGYSHAANEAVSFNEFRQHSAGSRRSNCCHKPNSSNRGTVHRAVCSCLTRLCNRA